MRSPVALVLALCACGGNAPQKPAPKLALQLTAHVERYGASTDASGSAARAVDIDKEATDVPLRNARIEATWVDEAGDRDEPGSVWALAVLDLDAQGRPALAPAGKPAAGNAMPPWLDRLPSAPGKAYATGYSGPTFRPEKAVDYAGDAAVDNLVATLRSRVQAYQLLVQNTTGLSVDEFSHTGDPEQSFRELVQKGARIEQVWLDQDGVRPGDPPGSAWALAAIDVPTTAGSYQPVDNPDIGPALDQQGNVPHRSPPASPAPTTDAPPR